MRIVLLLLAVLLLPYVAQAQPTSDPAPSDLVFADDVLPTISITLDPQHLAQILAPGNESSDEEFPAAFSFSSPYLQAAVDSVGFRLRGNTSRLSQKKSFKVSFNAFADGADFQGLEKLNLNGEHNDPSVIRSKLAWDMFREMGVPASRAAHVRLEINGDYFGLYMNVEHVDEQFLQRYFGNDDGNLYKSLWPADLTWLGPDASAYWPGDDRRPYDLKLKDDDSLGYDDLASFISVINQSSAVAFKGAIDRVFDVNGFLKALAVTVASGSWDSYWFLKNNFYLYHNPGTGRFHYVPFDFDNTFGIWWEGILPGMNWATRDVYAWGHPNEARPLAERILAVPEFRERYTYYLRSLLRGAAATDKLTARVTSLKAMTQAAAEADGFRVLDYGWSAEDYHSSFDTALGGHVTHGLIPFIELRNATARNQLDRGGIAPIISEVSVVPGNPRPTDAVRVRAHIESDTQIDATVDYWPGIPEGSSVSMTSLDDGWYEAVIPPLGVQVVLDVRVRASDADGLTRESNLVAVSVDMARPAIYVNELMAINNSSLPDEYGEFDDWVELYNADTSSVSLFGFFLSDDPLKPTKWTLPDTTINPLSYVLLWLDGQPEQGPLHAPFRLDGDGEAVILSAASGQLIDAVTFGSQQPDVSFARSIDAGYVWRDAPAPTPGRSNGIDTAVEIEGPPRISTIEVYPNPSSGTVFVRSPPGMTVDVYDLLGRRLTGLSVVPHDGPRHLDVSRFAPGVYLLRGRGSGVSQTLVVSR